EAEAKLPDLLEAPHAALARVESVETADGAVPVHVSQVHLEVIHDQNAHYHTTGPANTPYVHLREVTPSLRSCPLALVPAHPGVGKSVVAADFARYASMKKGVGTVMFSLERTRKEMGQRVMAAEAMVDFTRLRDKKLTEEDWKRAASVKPRFDEAPFWMSDD